MCHLEYIPSAARGTFDSRGNHRGLGASKDDEHPHHRRDRAADSGNQGAGATVARYGEVDDAASAGGTACDHHSLTCAPSHMGRWTLRHRVGRTSVEPW